MEEDIRRALLRLILKQSALMRQLENIGKDSDEGIVDRLKEDSNKIKGKYWRYIFGMIIALCALVIPIITEEVFKAQAELSESAMAIQELDKIQSSLNQLSAYIEGQKERIEDAQNTIAKLNKQKEELEPVVALADSQIIAVLSAYESKSRGSTWLERILAFVFGIIGSLLTIAIIGLIKSMRLQNKLSAIPNYNGVEFSSEISDILAKTDSNDEEAE